jgi:hypothetical protein
MSMREFLAGIPASARLTIAIVLLACFGGQGVKAQADPNKLVVQRSTRAIPHRFTVHPDEATVTVNSSQRFEVTDAQGNPVAVHWNVSGIGCAGANCGTIDDQGVYRTPPSLPRPGIVTLEGVLASDPNYSVLTQVVLKDPAAASHTPNQGSAPGRVAAAAVQPLAAPEIGRQSLAKNTGLPPLTDAVAAAPVVRRQSLAGNLAANRGSQLPPNVVPAAPAVGTKNLARGAALPTPNAIAAAPSVTTQNLARSAAVPPPNVVAAAPSVTTQNLARSAALPAPNVVSAAPAVGTQNLGRSAGLPAPSVIAAAPSVPKQSLARNAELPAPNVVAAAPVVETPVVETKKAARSAALPTPKVVAAAPSTLTLDLTHSPVLPTPRVVAAAPPVETQKPARNTELPTPNVVAAAPPVTTQNLARNAELPTPTVTAPAPPAATQKPARSGEGLPSSVIAAALPTGKPNPIRNTELPAPQTMAALVAPAANPIFTARRTEHLATTGIEKPNVAAAGLLPMAQMTAAAQPGADTSAQSSPVVTYVDGQLTVNAENSTLAAVLKLIAEKTGAVIDVPAGSGQEKIFEHAGPGQPNDVLEQLLNGSAFNFIIVSSPQRPEQPAEVLLSLRGPEAPITAALQPKPMNIPVPTAPPSTATATPLPVVDLGAIPENVGSMSPEALGDLMRQKRDELREKLQSMPPSQ